MKILLDTNVLIAAFIAHGTCNELLEHCVVHHRVYASPFILKEFRDKLVRKFRFTAQEAERAAALLKSRFQIVMPSGPLRRICRDPDDDPIIAAAVAAECAVLVTGDKDLRSLKEIDGIRIISPSDFWAMDAEWDK